MDCFFNCRALLIGWLNGPEEYRHARYMIAKITVLRRRNKALRRRLEELDRQMKADA